ncbi:MAG: flavin reductase [Blautia sp.]|nr:flavin reductase [Blautia sp.]
MDIKALFKLSYGVFVLASKTDGKANACITNTCIQVANSPTRVAIAVLNTNYTCDMIKESKVFNLSLLDQSCTFDTIKHFGFQSGRDTDKLAGMDLPTDVNGIPYLNYQTCSVISCKVVDSMELGSHTLFIAEVEDAVLLNDTDPLTYNDYQTKVKPQPQAVKQEKKIVGWRCKICGYVYEESELPADYLCPLCGHPVDDFEPVYED